MNSARGAKTCYSKMGASCPGRAQARNGEFGAELLPLGFQLEVAKLLGTAAATLLLRANVAGHFYSTHV